MNVGEIFRQVQTNNRTLEGCPRHHFTATSVKIGEKLTCEVCGGQMRLTDIGNYIRGYVAAGKSAEDIWPAYSR